MKKGDFLLFIIWLINMQMAFCISSFYYINHRLLLGFCFNAFAGLIAFGIAAKYWNAIGVFKEKDKVVS